MEDIILQSLANVAQDRKIDFVPGLVLDDSDLTPAPVHVRELKPDDVTRPQPGGCRQQDDGIIPFAPFAPGVNDTQDFLKFFVGDVALDMFPALHFMRKKPRTVRGSIAILFEKDVEMAQIQEYVVEGIELHFRRGFQDVLLDILHGHCREGGMAKEFKVMEIALYNPGRIVAGIFAVAAL